MEQKEYEFGQATRQRPRRGPMGMGRGSGEKAKDLVGTWKKLFGYCRRYAVVFVIALLCAALGTVLTLIGPDKLSDMTDTITDGIAPDTDALESLIEAISENSQENMQTLMERMTESFSDPTAMQEKAGQIMASPDISDADKQSFMDAIQSMAADPESAQTALLSLPESVLELLFADVELGGVTISPADQVQTMQVMQSLSDADESDVQESLQALPESVQNALYSDVEVDGVTITADDQREMAELFSDIELDADNTADAEAALDAMDQLPDSVYSLIKPEINMEEVARIGILLIGLYALSYILSAVQGWIMATITQRVSKQLRSDISRKISRLPMAFYNRTTTGDVLSRVTNDVDMIGQSLNQSFGNLITSIILFFGSLLMMLLTNGWMTLTAVGASVLGFVIMFAIMGKSQKYFSRQQRRLGEINGHIEEIYAGHTVVKAYNGEEAAQKTFDRMNDDLRESGFRAQCLAGMMMPIMMFIGNLGYVAVCVVGGALALNGKIGFGVIVAFMIYVRYFTQPLQQIAQAVQSLQSAAAAGERVFEFLEAEEMEDESGKTAVLDNIRGEVEFDHVQFGYEDTDTTLIHDFSAKAKPGQKIAIVGPTGAGKTTMVNLLMRFHEIQGGEIRIDGVSTKDFTREAVHSGFCMVLQDTWIFEGTLRENLVYCTENVSDEKIQQACKAVGLDHFIRTLPDGYDTMLSDQLNLSQGQKQQLTIARAMIADKPMLILDEATSSVDTRTEQKIQTAMDQLMQNRTSFVIAHRLSTIKNADLILVMKNGDIIESGTHDELLSQNGFYAELYNSQFEQAS